MIHTLTKTTRPAMSNALTAEIKIALKALGEYIAAKRQREAAATLLVLLFIDSTYVLARLRRGGVLRASRYGYKGNLIGNIAKAALQIRPLMNAKPERIQYLESVIALSKLATNARTSYDEIVNFLQTRRDCVLKTLLVILNNQFYNGWVADPLQPSTSIHRHTSEEYAEAASLIFSIYASLLPITDEICNHVDTAAIKADSGIYERLLLAAIRLAKFRDAETLIDGLPYQATLDGATITIASIDPDIERSVRLGYIQSEQQAAIRAHRFSQSDPPMSVRELVDKGFESDVFADMFDLVERPVKRYRLMLPGAPKLFSIFSDDKMFRDELERLLFLDVNHFGSIDELITDVNEHVKTTDIFKLQRYFTFLGSAYQRQLEQIDDKAERLFLTFTSTVFVLPHENLFAQMMLIFDNETKVRAIIDLLTMEISAGYLDLQYKPLIDLGGHYVIAPHLLSASNLVRNAIVANGLQATAIGSVDPMLKGVTDALRDAKFKVETEFKLRAGGREFELDIVAWCDGHLFFFEGKNAYHPCSPHEMRNSYDHLKEAREQLDKRRETFRDPAHQELLFQKLGWAVATTSSVHTAIIIANRVFHGASLNGHPVRQAHELINVLARGEIVREENNLSLWASATFQTEDLVTYLGEESFAIRQLRALDSTEWTYSMGYRNLVFSSYVLDLVKIRRVMEEYYRTTVTKDT